MRGEVKGSTQQEGEPDRRLLLELAVVPTISVGSGALGSLGAFTVQGGTTVSGTLYGVNGETLPAKGDLYVIATYFKDPVPAELPTPFAKATYTIVLADGTIDIVANAERALNPTATGGFGFVPGGTNQLQITGGTGYFEGIDGVAVINPVGSLVATGGEGFFLDGVINISLYQDVEYEAKAVAVAAGIDPDTGIPLSFQGSGTAISRHSQPHADYLAGVEAQGAADTALNIGLALLGQMRT